MEELLKGDDLEPPVVVEDDDVELSPGGGVEAGESTSWRPLKLRFLRIEDMVMGRICQTGWDGMLCGAVRCASGCVCVAPVEQQFYRVSKASLPRTNPPLWCR